MTFLNDGEYDWKIRDMTTYEGTNIRRERKGGGERVEEEPSNSSPNPHPTPPTTTTPTTRDPQPSGSLIIRPGKKVAAWFPHRTPITRTAILFTAPDALPCRSPATTMSSAHHGPICQAVKPSAQQLFRPRFGKKRRHLSTTPQC